MKTLKLIDMERHPLELELEEEYLLPELARMPATRGECVDGPRPCPWQRCRYHLALEVTANGSLVHNHPGVELDELAETCALDVADAGGATLERVGELLGVVRERIRQIEALAYQRLRRRVPQDGE